MILLAACWLPAASASEKSTTVYTGTLGKQPVVFDFAPHNETSNPSYFYTRYHRTLDLSGELGADHLTLREGPVGGDARPLITLDRQADGNWRGNWQDPHGRILPILLHPAKPMPPPASAPPYLKQLYVSNTFEYLRLASLKPQAGKRERFMGHTLQWWRIPDTGTTSFEILDGYPDAERARINRMLMDRLWRETNYHYECIDGRFYGHDTYDETPTPQLLTTDLISVSMLIRYDCNYSGPGSYTETINLDAQTGRPITLEDILWVGKGKPVHYVENDVTGSSNSSTFDAYLNYRGNEFAPWLIHQWENLQLIGPPNSDDQCHYSEFYPWQYPTWYMTPDGIFIVPSYDHAERSCQSNDTWSVLPWSVVRKYPGRLRLTLPK